MNSLTTMKSNTNEGGGENPLPATSFQALSSLQQAIKASPTLSQGIARYTATTNASSFTNVPSVASGIELLELLGISHYEIIHAVHDTMKDHIRGKWYTPLLFPSLFWTVLAYGRYVYCFRR